MESKLQEAIQSVRQSEIAFSKFITANDTGKTGAHQSGFYIHKNSWKLLFDTAGVKGEKKDRYVTIRRQGDFETVSRFIYYGLKTRDEYRLTQFGKGFPYLKEENTGDLLIICKKSHDYYEAFVLQSDEEMEEFFTTINISASDTNRIIPKQFMPNEADKLLQSFNGFLKSLKIDFPATIDLATNARNCYNNAFSITAKIIEKNPDREIMKWIDAEFQLFKLIENDRYNNRIKSPFKSVEELVETANTILNRRKSRAGKSLEHHLSAIFKTFEISFAAQAVTEDNKKPDFLFPSIEAYRNPKFDVGKLIVLASKTTCKDRWRQVLNEADRIKTKHLFTLQQGISKNQLEEMYKYNVCLVVPKPIIGCFPKNFKEKILSLDQFVKKIKILQK
jgi:type II restriction enzyme